MGCVNKNGKEFKALMQKNNVSKDTLELIVHKYWLESKSEDSFPSDDYIQAQLGNMVYQESIGAVIKLWKQNYSHPLEFNSREELQAAYNEALNFFPPEAIFQYENNKGNFVLSVKEPVKSIHRGDDIIKPKRLDLGLEENRAYSIDKIRELFDRFNTDRTSKTLADKVFNLAEELGLNITFQEPSIKGLSERAGGRFNSGEIQYNKKFLEEDILNHRKSWVLLHEVLHAVTTYALDRRIEGNKKLQNFKSEIEDIFYEIKDRGLLKDTYGMANTHEFVAELANPVFRRKLQELDKAPKSDSKATFWSKILNAFKTLLGLHSSSQYYNRAMNALDNALNAFDLNAYMDYNDIRNSLREGMKKRNWKFSSMDIEQQRAALREHFMEVLDFKNDLSDTLKERLKQAEQAAENLRKDIIYAQDNDDTGSIQRQTAESRRQNFENLYKDILSNVSIFRTNNGGLGINAIFKTFEELLREENADLTKQLNWVDNLSDEDIQSLTSLLEQEQRDYDLVYTSAELDKDENGGEEFKSLYEEAESLENQRKLISFDTSKAEFYSGAAIGSDKYWGDKAKALGIKVKDYTPQDWDKLTPEWQNKLDKEYQEVVNLLGRRVLDINSYSGKLVRRDMMQADKADAIFAIGTIANNGYVSGGTGYAATRGIVRGIPVYLFDQSDNQWKVWDKDNESFTPTMEPVLTPHAATIGTRELNDNGRRAIDSILTKTLNNTQQQVTQQYSPEDFFAKQDALDYINDLVNVDGVDRNLIELKHTSETDTTDEYWTVSVKEQPKAEGNNNQEPVSYTVDDIFRTLKATYQVNSSESKLADLVYNAIKNTDVVFESADLGEGISGKFVASENKILYNPKALQGNTLLHEAIHAVTSYYLKTANRSKLPEEIQIAIKEIEECYELLKQDFIETHFYEKGKLKPGINVEKAFDFWIKDSDTYGYTSPAEMLAELGKASFVEHIRDFDRRHKGKNIFQRLIDSIAALFGINKSYGSLEATVKKALVTLLTHPDKALMERYAKENKTVKENISKLQEQSTVHITASDNWINKFILSKVSEERENNDTADVIITLTQDQARGAFQVNEGVKNPLTNGRVGTIITTPTLYMMLNGNVTYSEDGNTINIPIRIFSRNYLQNNKLEIKKAENGAAYIAKIDNATQQTPKSSYNKIGSKEAPLQIYSDGSDIKGTGNIGYGSVFEFDGKEYGISGTQESEEVKKLQEKFPDAKFSNPTMEMLALTTTLEHFANVGNGEDIVINQDYKGAVNYQGLWEHSEGSQQRDTKAWKAKEPYIAHLVERASTAIGKIVKDGGSVKINWVKGHQSGTSEQARMNNAADRFAKSRNISNNINDAYEKQNTQQNLPGPETKINIYAGTGENADLSNFAKRPFNFREGYEDETSEAHRYFMDLHPLLPQEFDSVEQAFQAFKWAYALKDTDFAKEYIAALDADKSSESYKRGDKIFDVLNKIVNSNNGAEIKKLGGTRGLLTQEDIKFWDGESSIIMKFLIKQSFKQNPQALQRLLATGNATLTHTQDKGKWGTEFPRLLMEVREELRGQQQQATQPQQPNAEGNMTFSYGDNKRADVSSTTTFDAILNGERTATTRYESDGHIDYWKNLKVGDIIKWKNGKGREVLVKVTKPLTKLSTRTSAEEWSKKEGWSVEYFNSKVKPKLKEAWQIEYELMTQQSTQQQNQVRENRQEPQFTKVNDDFAQTLIDHFKNDKLEGYESLPKREALVRMAEALFDYFKKNDIKIVITNAPYSDKEKGISSAVSATGKYAAIFFQNAPLQGGKYLNILHELLHIATNNAIPFDSMGRAIADEKMQMYYNMFQKKIMEDKEWKIIQDLVFNNSKELMAKASDRAKILAHAYSSAGEFISCAVSNAEVQRVLESITYGEAKESNLFEELRRWFTELFEKIFHGYSYIAHENFLDDVTDFLLNTEYSENNGLFFDDKEQETEYNKFMQSLEERYNNAKDFVNPNITRMEDIPEKSDTFVIQLPNYQNHHGMAEVEVDAQWKVAILQDLDNQLNQELTEREKNNILDEIDYVIDALSEEEYNQTKSQNQQLVNKTLDEYDRLTQQINNLLDTDLITASEVRYISELVINSVSDDITEIQKNPDIVKEWFPELNINLDLSSATRREIVDAIGINNFFERAKKNFDPETSQTINYDDMDQIGQAFHISDNWDALIRLASGIFAANEGFGIEMNFTKGKFETISETNIGLDDAGEYKDIDSIQEKEGDAQEYWQIESRTIDILNSMSQLVRLALHQAYLLDKDGNKVMSKWGIAERVNARTAVNSILRWTQGSKNLDEMIQKMSEKAKTQPWVQQIIDRLQDKSGNEADFQSQFYNTFQKHFQLYSIVKGEDGKYHCIVVNEHPALSQAVQGIVSQFQAGIHPLFTGSRINRDLLGREENALNSNKFTLHKAKAEIGEIIKEMKTYITPWKNLVAISLNFVRTEFTSEEREKAIRNIVGASRILGFNVTEEMIDSILTPETLQQINGGLSKVILNLEEQLKNPSGRRYEPFINYSDNNILTGLRSFLKPITDQLEDEAVTAFYDSGKMYQSYVTPSFTTKLMNKFHIEDREEFRKFIEQEYGQSEWYYNSIDEDGERKWRFGWLKLLTSNRYASNEDAPNIVFDHKVQLNFNGHNYMKTMNDDEYTLSLIAEYFSIREKGRGGSTREPAWFRAPMESNKPSSEFFKFYSDRSSRYKDNISEEMYNLFLQEAARIQTVRMRNLSEGDPGYIKNWDKNGRKFTYLQFLNNYLEDIDAAKKKRTLLKNEDSTPSKDNEKLAILIQDYISGKELSTTDNADLITLVTLAIKTHMQEKVDEIMADWERKGIIDAATGIDNIGEWYENFDQDDPNFGRREYNNSKEIVRNRIENFIWNDKYAAINILQLMVGDTAFYKDAEDLQKRLAQLHAPGIRANIHATDYKGNPISDGRYRTILIKDFDPFKANIIANLEEVFDRKIQQAPESEKAQWESIKDNLLRKPGTRGPKDKGGKYYNINVTDGQGYSSISSYRKKALMFGKWSQKAEKLYNDIRNNNYNYTDIETAFQPLKPFVYTHLQKNLGVEGAPIQTMNVPFQAKNSEYLLIMADAILQNEQTSRPNLLRAINRIMEESETLNPTRGIDTVQFGSAIKSGLQTEIDINQFAESPQGEEAAYNHLKNLIYRKDGKGNLTNQYNTDTFVHETTYDDYCMQQEIPEHFKDHEQAHGSQERMILPSDLSFWKDPNGPKDESNINYFEWDEVDRDGNVTHKKLNAEELRKEYEENIAEGIKESIEQLEDELRLDPKYSKKERNIKLSKILQREILSSPRYGVDLLLACSVDRETGEFRIPLGDPIQAKRIEQLINSIIKNRINKQTIAGGPIVQVSNWGTSRQLHIRFKDSTGKILLTEEEFNNKLKSEAVRIVYKNYEEYKKAEQGGIAYFEVFAPAWSKDMLQMFMDENGFIDIEAIEATDPELLKMISYRIPTEDKYSMAPMKVVGFMPREAGDALMLPYELTEIDDSDFDIDKRYVMRKDLKIVKRNERKVRKELLDIVTNSLAKRGIKLMNEDGSPLTKEQKDRLTKIEVFLAEPETADMSDKLNKWLAKQYRRIAYTTTTPSKKAERDNRTIDMSWAVLTNETVASQILNPGGFDPLKKVAYQIAAYKNPANRNLTWEELQKKDIDELKELSYESKDITWIDDEIRFYKQNAAGSNLIGVFAVNKVAHAILESNGYKIDVNEVCESEGFKIAGKEFDGRMEIDPRTDDKGNLIGKVLGSGVSASADTAKDPILDLININMTTANIFNTLVRLGMPFEDASLFMSQNVVSRMLREFNKRNLTGYAAMDNLIDEFIESFREKNNLEEGEDISGVDDLSREELIEGLNAGNETIDYKVIQAFKKIKALANEMRNPTFATRFNSISAAVGPQIVDNLIIEYKMRKFRDTTSENSTHFYDKDGNNIDIDDVFYDHPVLAQFARTVDIAKTLFEDMPAGSEGFQNIIDLFSNDESPMKGLDNRLFTDRKLLSKLADFYQSYLLVASGFADPSRAENMNTAKFYVDNYPKYFMQNVKPKYAGNALVDAIQLGSLRATGKVFLYINTTGMDQTEKEKLSSAWIDFHKVEPAQSRQLFLYNFFRAGIAFSPKTFMSLVPTYVKEKIKTKLKDGTEVSYLDTYRNMPETDPQAVLDQFVAHNWGESKLAPWKGRKGTKYIYDWDNNQVTIKEEKDLKDLENVPYMKTSKNKVAYLWKRIKNTKEEMVYELIDALGNNGEYLEMAFLEKPKSMENTTDVRQDEAPESMENSLPEESDASSEPRTERQSEIQATKNISDLVRGIRLQNSKLTQQEAEDIAQKAKKSPGMFTGFLENVFAKMGLNIKGKENVKNELNKYC